DVVGVNERVANTELEPMMRVAAGDDRQSERARLYDQHHLCAEVLSVDLERVEATQIGRGKFSQLFRAAKHVRTDAREIEVVRDVEKFAQRRLVAVRQLFGKRGVQPSQLGELREHDHVGLLTNVDLGARQQLDPVG